jgi:hypothetical protein
MIFRVPVMFLRQLIGMPGRFGTLFPRDLSHAVNLLPELLVPRRCLGQRAQIIAPLLEFGELCLAGGCIHLVTDLPINASEIFQRVHCTVDVGILMGPTHQ